MCYGYSCYEYRFICYAICYVSCNVKPLVMNFGLEHTCFLVYFDTYMCYAICYVSCNVKQSSRILVTNYSLTHMCFMLYVSVSRNVKSLVTNSV